jgi:hypothetical protein
MAEELFKPGASKNTDALVGLVDAPQCVHTPFHADVRGAGMKGGCYFTTSPFHYSPQWLDAVEETSQQSKQEIRYIWFLDIDSANVY